jgi:hypothetical protein
LDKEWIKVVSPATVRYGSAEESPATVTRQAAMEQLRALADEPLPYVPQSLAEHQAALVQLDAYVDRTVQAERDEQRAYIDQCESRRLWDWEFRARYDRHHPGGGDRCTCPAHRAWGREEPS